MIESKHNPSGRSRSCWIRMPGRLGSSGFDSHLSDRTPHHGLVPTLWTTLGAVASVASSSASRCCLRKSRAIAVSVLNRRFIIPGAANPPSRFCATETADR